MNAYILLLLSISAASANNYLLHKFSNRGLDGGSGILLFNAAVSSVWIILLGITSFAFDGCLNINCGAVLWGILYGAVMSAFLLCKMQAMSTGPVSLTAFVGNSSLLISTAFGVFILKEGATPIQIIGVILLIIALFMVASPENNTAKKSWKFWCSAFFVCAAATGIIFKLHQRSEYAANINGMMFAAAIASAIIFGISSLITAKKENKPLAPLPKSCIPYLIGCGAVSCIYNRLNIFLTGEIPSVIFYPVFNGTVLLISSLVGVAAFKEHLKKSQTIGIILGFIALVLASGTGDALFKLILK